MIKRNIIVSNVHGLLTYDDYVRFAIECYRYWNCLDVKNVDLIVEYEIDNKNTLRNTNKQWIYGMLEENSTFEQTSKFAEETLKCKNYIVARIRGRKIIGNIEIVEYS